MPGKSQLPQAFELDPGITKPSARADWTVLYCGKWAAPRQCGGGPSPRPLTPETGRFHAKARTLLGEADAMFGIHLNEAAGRTAYLAGFSRRASVDLAENGTRGQNP